MEDTDDSLSDVMENDALDESSYKSIAVKERLLIFVKAFIEEFCSKINEYYEEAKGKRKKACKIGSAAGKLLGTLAGVGGNIGGAVGRYAGDFVVGEKHKSKAKRVINFIFGQGEVDLGSLLMKVGFEIFRCFESQYMRADDEGGWLVALTNIAQDAVDRIMNGIDIQTMNEDNEYFQSKRSKNNQTLLFNGMCASFLLGDSKGTLRSYLSAIKVLFTDKVYPISISKIYNKVGIVTLHGNGESDQYFINRDSPNGGVKYGFRLLFHCEEGEIAKRFQEDIREDIPYVYSLRPEDSNWLEREISKSTENELCVTISMYRECHEEILKAIQESTKDKKQNVESIWFKMRDPLLYFTGREHELGEISGILSEEAVAVISGLDGVGKSELALKYASMEYCKEDCVVWVNGETYETTMGSFCKLYFKLGYTLNDNDGHKKTINMIMEDLYGYFLNFRTLLIFDNSTSYQEIEPFLPQGLPADTLKPGVLITSRSSDWDCPRAVMRVIKLKDFEQIDAEEFLKRYLSIQKDPGDTIKKLTIKLHNFPLALQQVADYIKYENDVMKNVDPDLNIIDYLEHFDKKTEELLECVAYRKLDNNHRRTVYTTLEFIVNEIQKVEHIGEHALRILNIMAYLSTDAIPPIMFLDLHGENMKTCGEAIRLLKDRSVVRGRKTLHLHGLVKEIVRLNIRSCGPHAECHTLRRALGLLQGHVDDRDYTSHIVSVWNHAHADDSLIDEFIIRKFREMDKKKTKTNFLHIICEGSKCYIIEHVIRRIEQLSPNELTGIINARDNHRATLLHRAAPRTNPEIARLLLEKGAKQDKMIHSWRPLHLAVKNGKLETVKLLIDINPDGVLAKTGYKFTCLHLASRSNFPDIVKLLLSHRKIDVNAQTAQNFTALHFAVQKVSEPIVSCLLEDRAIDVNAKTSFKYTPLHLAAQRGSVDIVRKLMDNGADLDAKTGSDFIPLHFAVVNNHARVVSALLSRKSDRQVNCETTKRNTPLHLAAETGSPDVAAELAGSGARLELRNADACTPLHTAVLHDRERVVRLLIREKADLNSRGPNGNTPLHAAVEKGYLNIVKLLLENNASSLPNDDQKYPLDLAGSNIDIIDMLSDIV